MLPNSSADLADAVSAYALILSGIIPLTLCWLISPQPRRWLFAYLCIFITGVPTVWMHGFGEQFPARIADIGTNLLLAWALQFAALGDYYSARTQRIVTAISGVMITAFVIQMMAAGPERRLAITFGESGEFTWGELLLIANSILAVALLYFRRLLIPERARPLLYLVTIIFLAGLGFATQSNHRVDFGVLAYHATWHIVGAYGFIVLWIFNHLRFVQVPSRH